MQLDALGRAVDAPRDAPVQRRGDVLAGPAGARRRAPCWRRSRRRSPAARVGRGEADATEVFAAALAGLAGGGASAPLLAWPRRRRPSRRRTS